MSTLQTVCTTLAVAIVVVILAAAGVIYSGVYNVAATAKHWPATRWALTTTVENSIASRAEDIQTPPLGDPDRIAAGAKRFDAMCTGCHVPPGGQRTAMAQGMYPAPPDLSLVGKKMSAHQIFWAIKHGIKASGMPAWGVTQNDEALWSIVALVKKLPNMTTAEYEDLKASDTGRGAAK